MNHLYKWVVWRVLLVKSVFIIIIIIIHVLLVLSNYLFQSKQACEAFTTVIITAPVCHVNIKKSNSISFSSFLSCFSSSVLLDYFRNMGWKCVQVLVFFLETRGYLDVHM